MFDNTEKFAQHVLDVLRASKAETIRGFTNTPFDPDNAFAVWSYNHAMSVVEELIKVKLERYKKGELDFD